MERSRRGFTIIASQLRVPLLGFALVGVLGLVPLVADLYWMRVISLALMFAALAQAINLVAGFAGYPAFGNVVFFGLGAYTTAIVLTKYGGPFWLGVILAVVISLAVVLTIGPLLLRLRGHYFAIATVGLNEMVKALVSNFTPLTGGGMGLSVPLPRGTPLEVAHRFYYLMLLAMALSLVVAIWFNLSRLGLACKAIRDDEVKAEAMGIRTTAVKTFAWAASAGITGGVGAIYAYWFSYIDPPSVFDMLISTKAFVIFLLGGAATLLGPIIAAFVIEYVSTFLWSHLLAFHLGSLGLLIVLIALFMPKGFVEFLRERQSLLSKWFGR